MKNKSKNKFLLFSVVSILAMFLGIVSTDAKTINKDDIPTSTYVIGTHMFTRSVNQDTGYNGRLTTKLIMLAAKTIDGDSLDDMIIYYKAASGKWMDGLSGQVISNVDTFEIKYQDMKIVLETPILTRDAYGCETTEEGSVCSVNYTVSNIYDVDGIEVYGVDPAGNYYLQNTYNKTDLETNENKISIDLIEGLDAHAVRAYKEVNGKKVYSGYSKIVEIVGPKKQS